MRLSGLRVRLGWIEAAVVVDFVEVEWIEGEVGWIETVIEVEVDLVQVELMEGEIV